MKSLLRALRGRSFALLWSGQSLSLVGDRVFQVALAWWVLEKTGSALAMGAVFIFSILPMLIFLLIGGVLVDRFPRVWLMILSDVVRGLVIGGMAVLAWNNALLIWHVYLISLISGFVEAFFQPAYRAVVPEITPEADLPSANSLTSLSSQFAGIIGPAAGAAIVALGGSPLAFGLDSLSFFVSAGCLLPLLKQASVPQARTTSPGVLGDLREGITAVTNSPWLWVTIAIAGISNIAYAGPMEVALPFLIGQRGSGVGVLGLFYSVSSAGSILAAVWMGHLPRLRRRGLTLYLSWQFVGVMVALIGLPVGVPVMLLAASVIGACNTILSLVWVNMLQERVPRHLLGRVTSVDYLGSFILLPVGYGFGGWAAERIGPALLFILGGTLQAVLIALGLLYREIREFD